VLTVIAGLSSGTFYSLTLTFVLTALPKRLIHLRNRGIRGGDRFREQHRNFVGGLVHRTSHLGLDLLDCGNHNPSNVSLHLFWNSARAIDGSGSKLARVRVFQRFACSDLRALDQGERLDWLNSGVIVAMLVGGVFLLVCDLHSTLLTAEPNAETLVSEQRIHRFLALSIFCSNSCTFQHLSSVPGFLNTIRGYRPLETGHALAWVAVPMFAVVWLVAWLAIIRNSRLTLALGLTLAALPAGAVRISIRPGPEQLRGLELLLALGLAGSYVGLVSQYRAPSTGIRRPYVRGHGGDLFGLHAFCPPFRWGRLEPP